MTAPLVGQPCRAPRCCVHALGTPTQRRIEVRLLTDCPPEDLSALVMSPLLTYNIRTRRPDHS